MDISRGLNYTPQSLPIDKQQQKIQYYSPFDDLFGLAALLKPSGCDSLSESPNSDRSCWREHERERSESDEGSVFGSDKDPSSPTAYLTGFKPLDSPTFYSQREFDFQIPLDDIQNRSHNQRLHSVPISKSRQPLMTITYDDFLKSIDTIGPLINSGAGMGANHSPAQQPSATRFDATSLLGRSNSVSVGVTVLEKKGSARYCVFCKNNGEEEHFYNGHVLKSDNGIIVCPVLRAYQCPICHASGDYAHTIKYCPLGKGNEHDWLNSRSGSGRNSRLASNKV